MTNEKLATECICLGNKIHKMSFSKMGLHPGINSTGYKLMYVHADMIPWFL